MKSIQLAGALRAAATLLGNAGCTIPAQELHDLAEAIGIAGDTTVRDLTASVRRQGARSGRQWRLSGPAVEQLVASAIFFRDLGVSKLADDCEMIAESLARGSPFERYELVAYVQDALTAPRTAQRQAPPTNGDDATALSDAVHDYADRLTATVRDETAFNAVIADICGDRSIALPALKAIAGRFLGAERVLKSRNDVLKALETRRRQEAEQMLREEALAKVPP